MWTICGLSRLVLPSVSVVALVAHAAGVVLGISVGAGCGLFETHLLTIFCCSWLIFLFGSILLLLPSSSCSLFLLWRILVRNNGCGCHDHCLLNVLGGQIRANLIIYGKVTIAPYSNMIERRCLWIFLVNPYTLPSLLLDQLARKMPLGLAISENWDGCGRADGHVRWVGAEVVAQTCDRHG